MFKKLIQLRHKNTDDTTVESNDFNSLSHKINKTT